MPIYSKNGTDFYEVDEEIDTKTGESIADKTAKAKGYQKYFEVTKDGTTKYTIPEGELKAAFAKGYKIPQLAEAEKGYKEAIKEEVGRGTAALSGASQGLSFGYADELAGGISALGHIPEAVKQKSLTPFKEAYTEERDKARMIQEAAQEKHPVITTGAELGAGLLGGAGAAKGVVRTIGAGKKILEGGKVGLGYGALQGGGSSEADLTKGEYGEFAKDVGTGAAVGGVVGAAVPLATETIKAPFKTQELRRNVLKPDLKTKREMVAKGEDARINKAIEGEKELFRGARSSTDIYDRASELAKTKAKELDDIIPKIQQDIEVNNPSALNDIQQKALDAIDIIKQDVNNKIRRGALEQAEGEKILKKLEFITEESTALGGLPASFTFGRSGKPKNVIGEIQQLKKGLYERIGDKGYEFGTKSTAEKDAFKSVAKKLDELIDNVGQYTKDTELGNQYKELNNKYSRIALIKEKALDAAAKQEGKPGLKATFDVPQMVQQVYSSEGSKLARADIGDWVQRLTDPVLKNQYLQKFKENTEMRRLYPKVWEWLSKDEGENK